MSGSVRLSVKGQPSNVVRFSQKNPLVFQYLLPSNTLEGREAKCGDADSARELSIWAQRMMATKALAGIIFRAARQANGTSLDCVIVKFKNEQALARLAMVEVPLLNFASNVNADGTLKNPKLALLNFEITFSETDLRRAADKLIKEKTVAPHIAAIETLVGVFNAAVASPDGGEFKFLGYRDNNGVGSVYVERVDACGTCMSSDFSADRLEKLLKRYLPNTVQSLKIKKTIS